MFRSHVYVFHVAWPIQCYLIKKWSAANFYESMSLHKMESNSSHRLTDRRHVWKNSSPISMPNFSERMNFTVPIIFKFEMWGRMVSRFTLGNIWLLVVYSMMARTSLVKSMNQEEAKNKKVINSPRDCRNKSSMRRKPCNVMFLHLVSRKF